MSVCLRDNDLINPGDIKSFTVVEAQHSPLWWLDVVPSLLNRESPGGWRALNCLCTSATVFSISPNTIITVWYYF